MDQLEEKILKLENRIIPIRRNYKVIYSKSINVNGIKRKPKEVFVSKDSQEMRNLVREKYLEDFGEYDD